MRRQAQEMQPSVPEQVLCGTGTRRSQAQQPDETVRLPKGAASPPQVPAFSTGVFWMMKKAAESSHTSAVKPPSTR